MFDPLVFAAVAEELAEEGAHAKADDVMLQGRLRTAFGRVYYALFLVVRGEITRRHAVPSRRLRHGAVYSLLQSTRLDPRVRDLGRELERLYRIREQADYVLDPAGQWQRFFLDPAFLADAAKGVHTHAAAARWLDFSPVIDRF